MVEMTFSGGSGTRDQLLQDQKPWAHKLDLMLCQGVLMVLVTAQALVGKAL